MNFIYFVGRFHVLVLHLPITLVLVVVLLEWLSRKDRFRYFSPVLPFLWAATAVSAIATVVLGFLHFSEGGFTGPSATAHRLLGTGIAIVATLAWLLRTLKLATFEKVQPAISALLLILVVLTGHFGGNLTHGETYLVEYAPEPLRRLAGIEARRPPIADLAMADPYLDIARPIFSQRCFSCHNDDKKQGGLNLANYAAVMKGGDDGPVVVAGDVEKSDLIRRISLPHDDEDAMPAEGKTPLTDDQVKILRWWVTSGAATGAVLGAAEIPAEVRPLLQAMLGIGASGSAVASAGMASEQRADAELVSMLVASGFMVRQEDLSDPHLIVSAPAPGGHYTEEQLAGLAIGGPAIVELSLSRSNLQDPALATIGRLTGLTHLRLDNNQLTDNGLKALSGLEQLAYLNVHANKGITDASIDQLAKLPKLQSLYVWNTGITASGAARLKRIRPEVNVDVGQELAPSEVAVAVPKTATRG